MSEVRDGLPIAARNGIPLSPRANAEGPDPLSGQSNAFRQDGGTAQALDQFGNRHLITIRNVLHKSIHRVSRRRLWGYG